MIESWKLTHDWLSISRNLSSPQDGSVCIGGILVETCGHRYSQSVVRILVAFHDPCVSRGSQMVSETGVSRPGARGPMAPHAGQTRSSSSGESYPHSMAYFSVHSLASLLYLRSTSETQHITWPFTSTGHVVERPRAGTVTGSVSDALCSPLLFESCDWWEPIRKRRSASSFYKRVFRLKRDQFPQVSDSEAWKLHQA